MSILGDVFGIVATLIGLCLTAWALILAHALLFDRRAAVAETQLREHAGKSFLLGLVIAAPLSAIGLSFLANPLPGAKLVGWFFLVVVLSLGALGMAGLAGLASSRIRQLDPECSPFRALTRGAALLVIAALVPVLGWFVLGPIALIFAVGAGTSALFARATSSARFDLNG